MLTSGIPMFDGYEFVRIGQAYKDEYWLNSHKKLELVVTNSNYNQNYAVYRKIIKLPDTQSIFWTGAEAGQTLVPPKDTVLFITTGCGVDQEYFVAYTAYKTQSRGAFYAVIQKT